MPYLNLGKLYKRVMNKLKIAIVHDFLIQQGGAEKVLESLLEAYPDAHLYTLLVDTKKIKKTFSYTYLNMKGLT